VRDAEEDPTLMTPDLITLSRLHNARIERIRNIVVSSRSVGMNHNVSSISKFKRAAKSAMIIARWKKSTGVELDLFTDAQVLFHGIFVAACSELTPFTCQLSSQFLVSKKF
jgi:hypothetical protein